MKSKKIRVLYFAIAVVLLQSTCVYASTSKDSYSQDDLNNMEPGFGWEDINKSKYKVATSVNSYSSTKTPEEVAEELGESTTTTSTSTTTTDNTKTQNTIVKTQPIAGVSGLYWGSTSSGSWMLFEQGVPVTGWKLVSGKWYYMNLEGIMQTGWLCDGTNWYYLYSSGVMACNTYVDGYYLDSNGVMQ